jgi:hypothetical protein
MTVAHVEVLPHASAAVHVIVEVPTLNVPFPFVPLPLRVVAPVI